jgi:hypothetical protein
VLPNYLRSNGSGTGSTQSRESNRRAAWKNKQRLWSRNARIRPYGIRHGDHVAPSMPKTYLVLTSPKSGGLSEYIYMYIHVIHKKGQNWNDLDRNFHILGKIAMFIDVNGVRNNFIHPVIMI